MLRNNSIFSFSHKYLVTKTGEDIKMWGGCYFEDPHDNVTERLNRLEEYQLLKNLEVLDLGCGRGNISFAISIRGSKVVALDIKRTNIYEAKILEELHKNNIPSKVDFLIADALHLPFKDEIFDAAVLSDLLEHVRSDKQILAETWRILKRNGFILVTVPNRWQLIEHHVRIPLFGYLPTVIQRKKIGNEKWVKRLYTKLNLKKLISTHFTDLYIGYLWPNFDCARKKRKKLGNFFKRISNFISKTPLSFLGTSLILIGNKKTDLSPD